MDCLNCASPEELVVLSSAAAIAIAKDLDADELSSLGAFFTTLGDNLSLIASQRGLNDSHCKN